MNQNKRKMRFLKWMRKIKNVCYSDTERMDRALDGFDRVIGGVNI